MGKYCCKPRDWLDHFLADSEGVVSFEYVIVAACIVGAVAAAFGTNASSGIGAALQAAITAIAASVTAAV